MLLVLVTHQTCNSLLALIYKRQEKPPKHSSPPPFPPILLAHYTHYWYSHVRSKHTPDKTQQLHYHHCSYDQILSDSGNDGAMKFSCDFSLSSLSQDALGFLVDWLCYCFKTLDKLFYNPKETFTVLTSYKTAPPQPLPTIASRTRTIHQMQ